MAVWSSGKSEAYEAEQAERVAVFNKITPAGNWKWEIDCWIEATEFAECNEAAIWFTGGPLMIVGTSFAMIHVKGAGYYSNVGA